MNSTPGVRKPRHVCLAVSVRSSLYIFLLLAPVLMAAQATVLYEDAEASFQAMVKEYDQGLYGRAARSSEIFLAEYRDPQFEQLILEAQLYQLKSWLRMDVPGTIENILAFASYHRPGPVAQRAIMMIGEYEYERNNYDDAIKYLSLVNSKALSSDERSALNFKLGYSLFVRKEFNQASGLFSANLDVRDKYYYPSHYYFGMTQYFLGNYDAAIRAFEHVAPSDYYKDFIPYYIAQIHFNNKDYQKVIGYGNHSLENPGIQNKTEIRHLMGQAYFETGDYASALPHLEYVEKNSEKLRTEDFYQLGMSYYHTARYSDAIPVLMEIRNEEGMKSHYANYYLGQAYLKTNDKTSARNSLRRAMQMEDVHSLSVEAAFHYGRLSAEAGDDVEAIRVLQTIPASSPDYQNAQTTLAGILTNTSDYSLAIKELEAMKNLTPPLKEAYQKVTLYRAEQLLQEGMAAEAEVLLDKSLQYSSDPSVRARALFWKGELAHQAEQYRESIKWYDQYFTIAEGITGLPSHASLPVANYNQGYNYLRLADFVPAQKHFESSVNGVTHLSNVENENGFIRAQLLPDALLRAGDASFKRNQYDKAIQYYDQSIQKKFAGHDYARYQKALIRGLQNKPQEKIALMEEIANTMSSSLWVDDALLQAGNTYQDQNQNSRAIASYERIVSLKPQSPLLHTALLRLGLLSYNNNQFADALKYYKSVFQYHPDPQTTKEAMSAIQEIYVNELDKPEAYFEFAGSIPGFAVSGSEKDSILYAAAENHYALGAYEKAADAFAYYIGQNPRGVYAQKAKFLRAESLSLARKWDDALLAYEEVIKSGQSAYLASSLYKAALIAYNQKQDMARAYTYYNSYIQVAESEELQYEAMVGALRSAYKLKKAEDVYAMATRVNNHSRATDDMRATAYYYTATLARENNDDAKAITSYNAVIRINSAELAAESRYYIATIYEENGESTLAEKLAEESARANVGYPFWVAKSLLLLSDIQFKKNDLLNAKAILEAILENFQGDEEIVKEATQKLEIIREAETDQNRIKKIDPDTLELQVKPKND